MADVLVLYYSRNGATECRFVPEAIIKNEAETSFVYPTEKAHITHKSNSV